MNLTVYQTLLLDGLIGASWHHFQQTGEACCVMIGLSWNEFISLIDRSKTTYSERCNAVDYFEAKLKSDVTSMECWDIILNSPELIVLSTKTHIQNSFPILKKI